MSMNLILSDANFSNADPVKRWDGSVSVLPSETRLLPNYPNPFNPETWIPYQLAENAHVRIRIYNALGQLARILDLGEQEAGVYLQKGKAAYWDGKDALGHPAASGIYFYQLQADDFTATRRMAILK